MNDKQYAIGLIKYNGETVSLFFDKSYPPHQVDDLEKYTIEMFYKFDIKIPINKNGSIFLNRLTYFDDAQWLKQYVLKNKIPSFSFKMDWEYNYFFIGYSKPSGLKNSPYAPFKECISRCYNREGLFVEDSYDDIFTMQDRALINDEHSGIEFIFDKQGDLIRTENEEGFHPDSIVAKSLNLLQHHNVAHTFLANEEIALQVMNNSTGLVWAKIGNFKPHLLKTGLMAVPDEPVVFSTIIETKYCFVEMEIRIDYQCPTPESQPDLGIASMQILKHLTTDTQRKAWQFFAVN